MQKRHKTSDDLAMRTLPTAYIGFLLFILMLVLSVGGAPVFGDADTAWHLAAGDLIRSSGHIPTEDPWSFTAAGEHWYNLSWLFDIVLSGLFALGGFSAVYAFTIGVFAALLTFMGHQSIKQGASPLVVFLLMPLMMLVIFGGVIARPTLCSLIMAVAFYSLLQRYRVTGHFRTLLILPLLMVLWVNLHGGFLLAFLMMGLFLLEATWEHNSTRRKELTFIIALCLLATLFNPYGFTLYYGAYKTLAGTFSQLYVSEWRPVQIGHNLPMTLLLLLVLVTGNSFDKRIALADRMLGVVMVTLALTSVRYSIFAALLLMPMLSLRLTTLLLESKLGACLRAQDALLLQDMQKPDIRAMALVMAALAFLFLCSPNPRDQLLDAPVGFPAKHFPDGEAAFIEANYPKLQFLNDYNTGGYLDYLWRGRVKVFVDGRANSLYTDELLDDYITFFNTSGFGGRAQVTTALYHVDGLIIPNDLPDASLWRWNPNWKVVYTGNMATVYVRKGLEK